jgi:hypothetical protein
MISVTDPGNDVARVVVDYGDGSTPVPLNAGSPSSFELSHAYLGVGRYTVTVLATDTAGAATTATLVVDVTGAGARRFVIGDGTVPRSRIDSLRLEFDQVVSLQPGALTLRRSNGRCIPLRIGETTVQGTTALTLRFRGCGVRRGALPDGRYTFTLDGSRVTGASGAPLDLTGDGQAGDDYVVHFHSLFGDLNGDGRVDRRDVRLARGSYLNRSGQPGYLSVLDFNGNGVIGDLDAAAFRRHLGRVLRPRR